MSPLWKRVPEPPGDRLAEGDPLALCEDGDPPEGGAQVVVVEDPDVRKNADRGAKVGHRAGEACDQLLRGDIVPALGDAHGHALLGDFRAGDPDEAEHDGVAAPGRLLEKGELRAGRVGEDGLEDEALALRHELATQRIGDARGGIGGEVELPGHHVGVHEAKPGSLEVRPMERRLAGAIRPRHDHDEWSRVERRAHRRGDLPFTGTKRRLTKRPVTRRPSAFTRTSSPGESGAAS